MDNRMVIGLAVVAVIAVIAIYLTRNPAPEMTSAPPPATTETAPAAQPVTP